MTLERNPAASGRESLKVLTFLSRNYTLDKLKMDCQIICWLGNLKLSSPPWVLCEDKKKWFVNLIQQML